MASAAWAAVTLGRLLRNRCQRSVVLVGSNRTMHCTLSSQVTSTPGKTTRGVLRGQAFGGGHDVGQHAEVVVIRDGDHAEALPQRRRHEPFGPGSSVVVADHRVVRQAVSQDPTPVPRGMGLQVDLVPHRPRMTARHRNPRIIRRSGSIDRPRSEDTVLQRWSSRSAVNRYSLVTALTLPLWTETTWLMSNDERVRGDGDRP